jgi:hypothetical protein
MIRFESLSRVGRFGICLAVCGAVLAASLSQAAGQEAKDPVAKDPVAKEKKIKALEEEKTAAKPQEKAKEKGKGAPSLEDLDAQTRAWMEAATPGKEHAALVEHFSGKWDVLSRFFPAPGAPPEESKGSAVMMPIFDGRFVEQRYKGSYMGMPFEGIGFSGYDNVKKEYNNVWLDSMGTMIMISSGTFDAGGAAYSYKGTYTDPLTKKELVNRMVGKIESSDRQVWEAYSTGPDGKEFKMMELVYTRRPAKEKLEKTEKVENPEKAEKLEKLKLEKAEKLEKLKLEKAEKLEKAKKEDEAEGG